MNELIKKNESKNSRDILSQNNFMVKRLYPRDGKLTKGVSRIKMKDKYSPIDKIFNSLNVKYCELNGLNFNQKCYCYLLSLLYPMLYYEYYFQT